jgi:HK97 family phage major capsid protein
MELTYQQAVNRLKDIKDELDRLDGKPELTPEDDNYWGELVRESEEVEDHAKSLIRQADRQRVEAATVAFSPRTGFKVERGSDVGRGSDGGEMDRDFLVDPDSVEEYRFRNPWDLSEIRTFNRSGEEVGAELKARAVSAIEKMPSMSNATRERATYIVETFDNDKGDISRLALLTSTPAYLRAFSKAARGKEKAFTPEEQDAVTRAMSLTDAAGGFLVPFQLDPTVVNITAGVANDIRSVARQVVATGDIYYAVTSTAVSWSWDAEAAEVSDDATTFAQPTIAIYKGAGFVPISIEAMMDETNVTQTVADLLQAGKRNLENAAFATGTGTAQPWGIVAALTGTASEINAAADDTFAIADVYTIEGALPARYRENASWLANHSIYNLIRKFDTSGGGGFWANMAQGQPPSLLGRRAVESEAMDGTVTTAGAVSNFILVYGDFSNYVIADRIGTTVEFLPHLFAVGGGGRPTGQRGWYAYFRVGADSLNDDGFRLLDVPSAA